MNLLAKLSSAVASTFSRRRLGRAVLLAGLAGAAAGAQAAETVKVRLDFLPYGLHAPFYLAQDRGWFKEKGLDVTIDDGNGTGPALALIASNQYDIAQISLGALPIARDKGMPVKAIATIERKGDLGLAVDEKSGINTPKDLVGKTVVYSAGSIEAPFIDAYFQRAGVDKSKVNLMNLDVSAKIPSYMAGKGDAMLTPVPLYTIAGLPRKSKAMLFVDVGINVPGFGLIANDATIAKRPQVLKAFVEVFQRAWQAVGPGGEQIDAAVASLVANRPNAKLDPALMKAQIQSVYPYLYSDASKGKPLLWMAPADWKDTVTVMEELKLIKEGTSPESLYTNQFIPAGN